MSNTINLLDDKKNKVLAKTDSLRALRLSAISFLFIVSALSVILFILISLSPLPNLRNQERLAIATLSQYHTDMVKLFWVKERTDTIATFLAKRTSYDKSLEAIQSKLPDGVEVQSLEVEKNTVSLTVSSNSLDLLNTFVSNLTTSVNEKKNFSQITLSSLSLEEDKTKYLVSIILLTL